MTQTRSDVDFLGARAYLSIGDELNSGASPVIWALDAFSMDFANHARTAAAIRAYAPESPIHPVYVLSQDVFSSRGYSSFLRAALKPRAHGNIRAIMEHELLNEIRRSGALQAPRVLVESSAEASLCTGKLLRYAKRVGAQLVGIGTKGRSSLARFFTGSFAETLLRESEIPLLVTGPKMTGELKSPKTIVLPTDFQAHDRAAYKNLIQLAQQKEISVHLFHRSSHPLDTWVQSGVQMLGGSWISVAASYCDDDRLNLQEANEWLRIARDRGVTAKLATESFRESTAEAIVDYASKLESESTLIALLKDTRLLPNHGWLPESLTHDLIRMSHWPLYISGHA